MPFVIFLAALLFASCYRDNNPVRSQPAAKRISSAVTLSEPVAGIDNSRSGSFVIFDDSTARPETSVVSGTAQKVTVGPTLARCYGVGERTCMVVDGSLFYDAIEGFDFEAGYDYRLRIEKYDPWGGKEPPQDAGRYAFRLQEQLKKTPAASSPATLSLGPTRVKCSQIDDFCLLVDGAPYFDIVTGFEYEAGYYYTLDANGYSDGRYVLNSVVSKTEAAGTEEEITVAPHRIDCGGDNQVYCNVVNGEAFRSEIVGFNPWHGYSYRLRVERFDMFAGEETPASPDVPGYGYRWLETLDRSPAD